MADINGTSGNDVLQPYGSSLVLQLSGDVAEGIWPQLSVLVNGAAVISPVSITASKAAGATQAVSVPIPNGVAISTLSIQYLNDVQVDYSSQDRNMYVSSIMLNGTMIPTSAASYVRSADNSVVPGQDAMVWGGSLNFSGSVLNVPAPTTGNVSIDGGAGTDIVMFSGARSQYNASATSVARISGGESATLANVERLGFSDSKLAFDIGGNAGMAVKIVGALFGTAGATHKGLVGIAINLLDGGLTASQLAGAAAQTTLFTQLAGGSSNAAFVDYVVRNLGVVPSAETVNSIASLIDSGAHTRASLTLIAANIIEPSLVGVMQNGIEYV